MKFALALLLCALLPFAAGCASKKPERAPEPAAAQDGLEFEPIGSAASLGAGVNRSSETDEPVKAKPKGPAYLLRMLDYKSGARLELVNESHTAPIDQYSKVRNDRSRKVTSDEWMSGLIDYLRDNGWSKEEQKGSAPAQARGSLRWSLELIGPDGARYVAEAPEAKGSQLTRLRTIQKAFIDTYNATPQFQAVTIQEGELPFKVPDYQLKKSGK